MAARKQSKIATFLEQSQGAQELVPARSMYEDINKETAKAQTQQIEDTVKKAEKVKEATSKDNLAKSAGLQFDTSSYTAPTKVAATSQEYNQPGNIDLGTAGKQTAQITTNIAETNAADAVANSNMERVRTTFLNSGLSEAKKTYKSLFGTEMPEAVEKTFGTGYQDTLDLLKNPSNALGQFRNLSEVEQKAKDQADLISQNPLSGLRSIYSSVDPTGAALASQASLPQLQKLQSESLTKKAEDIAKEDKRLRSIEDFLLTQSEGRKNVADLVRSTKESTAGELKQLQDLRKTQADTAIKEIESKFAENNKNDLNTAIDNFSKSAESAMYLPTSSERYKMYNKLDALLEDNKNKISKEDYTKLRSAADALKKNADEWKSREEISAKQTKDIETYKEDEHSKAINVLIEAGIEPTLNADVDIQKASDLLNWGQAVKDTGGWGDFGKGFGMNTNFNF